MSSSQRRSMVLRRMSLADSEFWKELRQSDCSQSLTLPIAAIKTALGIIFFRCAYSQPAVKVAWYTIFPFVNFVHLCLGF